MSLARLRALGVGMCVLGLAVVTGVGSNAATGASPARAAQSHQAPGPTPLRPAAATGAFGLDLMATQRAGNLVLSPDSVATALAMTGTGAAGRTATEMASALHLAGPSAFDSVGTLQHTIAAAQAAAGKGHLNAPTLKLSDGLFLQQGFAVQPKFVSGLEHRFSVAPELLDFSGDPAGAVQRINNWVSENTEGVIPQLFGAPLPPETRLTLTNAVYFKGEWQHRFEPSATGPAPFHSPAGTGSVEFMHQTDRLSYGAGDGYRAVDLPYRASTLSLLIVLPVKQRLRSLERHLAGDGLRRVTRSLSARPVELSLPRFHLTLQTELTGALRSLGMRAAFGDSADFSGITSEPLKIDTVVHAADFKVDEEGTVAAAATGVVAVARSLARSIQAVKFNANRPFLFFLRDRQTGAVLFAGRLTNAEAASL